MKTRRFLKILVLVIATFLGGGIKAEQIYGMTPAANWRFTTNPYLLPSGGFTNPAVNASPLFLGAGYDWSGVGWNPYTNWMGGITRFAFAMVTPNASLEANHLRYVSDLGSPTFLNQMTQLVTAAAVQSQYAVAQSGSNDTAVVMLSSPIPSSSHVAVYSMLDPSGPQDDFLANGTNYLNFYSGQPVLMYGSSAIVGSNYVASTAWTPNGVANLYSTWGGWIVGFDYSSLRYATNKVMSVDDSGNPDFIPFFDTVTGSNRLTILGARYTTAYDSFLPAYSTVTNLNAYFAQSGYNLKWTGNPDTGWGGASNGNFATAANWTNGMPTSGYSAVFNGAAAGGNRQIDLGGSTQRVDGFFFKAGAGAGNGFTFTNGGLTIEKIGLVNYDANRQTFNVPISFAFAQNWDGGAGGLTFNGAITNNGYLLYIEGTGTNILNGAYTGSGGVAKGGAGTLLLTASNSYTGPTFLHEGTLQIQNAAGIPYGGQIVMDAGVLDLNGYSNHFASLSSAGGQIQLGAGQLNLALASTQTVAASVTGTGSLLMSGNGTLILAGTNSLTGGIIANAGMIRFAIAEALGGASNTITVGAGGGVSTDYTLDQLFVNRLASNSSGLLALGGSGTNFVAGLDLSPVPLIRLGSLGTNTYGGTLVTTSGVYRLGGGGGLLVISATNAFTGANSLDVSGSGSVLLAAPNSFTSGMVVQAGATLATASDNTLGAVPGAPVPGLIVLDNGTLRFTSNMTLNVNRGIALGPTSGSGGGTMEVDDGVQAQVMGLVGNHVGGVGGLVKRGLGTLVMSGSNVFGGDLSVMNGTLAVNAPMALSNLTVSGGVSGTNTTLNVASALLISGPTAYIGDNAFTGTVLVTGGQLVTTNGSLVVGYTGVGAMSVSNGTWLANQVTVGRAWNSPGTLTLAGGSTIANTVNVGAYGGSQGTLNITGGTNVVDALTVSVSGGSASVLMTGGRLVTTNNTGSGVVTLGWSGDGNMTVSGGTWLGNGVTMGYWGVGTRDTLNIAGGTNWLNNNVLVGSAGGTTGMVNVTGGALVITNTSGTAQLVVGAGGAGLFTLGGGMVMADQLWVTNGLSAFQFSNGTLSAKSATISNGSAFVVGDGVGNATLGLLGGTNICANGLTINTNATLLFSGANPTLSGGLVFNQVGGLVTGSSAGLVVNAAFTNAGTVRLVNSVATFNAPVVNSGAWISDPTTNTFVSNLTVTASGSLSGGTGDLFVFYRDFINQSTNRSAFNLSMSTVLFTNGAGVSAHTLNLTNSGALDMGAVGMNAVQLATNFSIGTLSISLSNNLTLTGLKSGATTNALYVGWLDLSAWNTNAGSLNTTLSNALALTDINLYYDAGDARNTYLRDASYALWGGGGLLIPIPEPSTTGLILGGALFSALLLRRRKGRK